MADTSFSSKKMTEVEVSARVGDGEQDEEGKVDIVAKISERDLFHVARAIFSCLSCVEVRRCTLVSAQWSRAVRRLVLPAWTEGKRCKYGWLTAPRLRFSRVELRGMAGGGCPRDRRMVEKVFCRGQVTEVRREAMMEARPLASADGRAFAVVRQYVGFPNWEADVDVYDGSGFVCSVRPSVPAEVAEESRFSFVFSDLVLTSQLVALGGLMAMPRGHRVGSRDMLWVFDRRSGEELHRHVVANGLGNCVFVLFSVAKDRLRVFAYPGSTDQEKTVVMKEVRQKGVLKNVQIDGQSFFPQGESF